MYDVLGVGNFAVVLSDHACGAPSEPKRVTVNQLFERTPEGLELILSASGVADNRRALRCHIRLSREGWFDIARKFNHIQEIVAVAQEKIKLIEAVPLHYGPDLRAALYGGRAALYGDIHLIDEMFMLHDSFSENLGLAGQPGPWEEYNPPSFYETLKALKALEARVKKIPQDQPVSVQ